MYGQFPMVSVGRSHPVSSPQSSPRPAGGGRALPQARRGPRGPRSVLGGRARACGFSSGVPAKGRSPHLVPSVSVNLDGLLVLADVSFDLFKFNFFSLREK